MKTPILLLIFNRPDLTKSIFNIISSLKPEILFISADGPRQNVIGEEDQCNKSRAIVQKINWDCQVKFLLHENNLGCKKAVSTAINWFFDHVDRGIILEDDCLPDESFFVFCTDLLEKFKDDLRVGHISGNNFLAEKLKTKDSYYFSNIPHVWGWATWRRAWKNYDVHMKRWPEVKNSGLFDTFFLKNIFQKLYWNRIFQLCYENKIDTWDFQWVFCCLLYKQLSINPNLNLVKNLGFDERATHTKSKNELMNLAAEQISFPLKHPNMVMPDITADNYINKKYFKMNPLRYIYEWITQRRL